MEYLRMVDEKQEVIEFNKKNIDIMVITEMKKKGNNTEEMERVIRSWSGVDKENSKRRFRNPHK